MNLVPLSELKPGMILAEDVYAFFTGHLTLLKKGECLTSQTIRRLELFRVNGIYVDDMGETEKLQKGLSFSGEVRDEAVGMIENLFEDIQDPSTHISENSVKQLNSVITRLVDTIHNNKQVLLNISDLKSYDDYTYHHSLSVSVLSLAIGMHLEMPKTMLRRLGISSILHDIGKMMVPIEIINKPGKLTEEEFYIIKEHPVFGAQYIVNNDLGDEEIIKGALGHHEKMDGTGYPYGLKSKEINMFSRIISVADVYDALTSKRSYREPMLPNEAAEYLMGSVGSAFDYDIVRAFIEKVELYPVGSFVQLSNGKVAIVISNEKPLRPVVRELTSPQAVINLFEDKNFRNVVITAAYKEMPIAHNNEFDEQHITT